jgi:hypothetical protein
MMSAPGAIFAYVAEGADVVGGAPATIGRVVVTKGRPGVAYLHLPRHGKLGVRSSAPEGEPGSVLRVRSPFSFQPGLFMILGVS